MPILYDVARNWWALTVRGVLAILFALMMFTLPGLTLASLALFFGVFAVIEGIFAMAVGFTGKTENRPRWAWIVGGLISIAAGVITLFWPGIALLSFLMVLAAWAFVLGITEIAGAIALRKEITGEWALILSGIVSILFAILLVARPGAGLLTIAFLIGAYALIWGILEITLSFRLRGFAKRIESTAL